MAASPAQPGTAQPAEWALFPPTDETDEADETFADTDPAGGEDTGSPTSDATPLSAVTFCIVDLETTGASAASSWITEIGAVRVRGGEALGELGVLVRPGEAIPAPIAALTGITDAMVADAPPVDAVLPHVLEMLRGSVLVAHNARFDVSFLVAACERAGLAWPAPPVLDTLALARSVLPRGEVPNHKLATLAQHLRAGVVPSHRALDDARATVDVLHALIGRVGRRAATLGDLRALAGAAVPTAVRRQRHLADDVPSAPGVYLFADAGGRVLYVGTSRDLRARVRTYFTASERRPRMREMVTLAASVTPVVCGTVLEAQVRELRLIAEHDPPYNRRSRRPERAPWVKLTNEAFPRLSLVRTVGRDAAEAEGGEIREGGTGKGGATYLGPFASLRAAQAATDALLEAFPLRRCTSRLPARAAPGALACVLAQIGRCGAPCTGGQSVGDYASVVAGARASMCGDPRPVVDAALVRIERLVADERFEESAAVRDELTAFLRGAGRTQRIGPLAAAAEIVAARRTAVGGWEIVCVRHGRLAGTTQTPRGADPMPYVAALRASAEVVPEPPPPSAAGSAQEAELVLAWLENEGVRLVHVEGRWVCPTTGAQRTDATKAMSAHLRARSLDSPPGPTRASIEERPSHAGEAAAP